MTGGSCHGEWNEAVLNGHPQVAVWICGIITPYGGRVVELGVCLMVGGGLIPLLGVLYHPDTLAGSTQWGSKPNGII